MTAPDDHNRSQWGGAGEGADAAALDSYILAHITPEPPHLHKLYRHTNLTHLYPRMCSGHLQGRVLSMLTSMIAPVRALELGTFTGYSALSIAEGLAPGGKLHTVEIDDEMEDELLGLFATSPGGENIVLHIGDALTIVPQLGGEWDMVFIDANKRHYADYLEMVLPMMRPGGYILADNTLWDGNVSATDGSGRLSPQTEGIMRFNDLIATHPAIESVVILPLRDGLTLARVAR